MALELAGEIVDPAIGCSRKALLPNERFDNWAITRKRIDPGTQLVARLSIRASVRSRRHNCSLSAMGGALPVKFPFDTPHATMRGVDLS
ncbi:hypothetical protein [Sphingosinicella sp. YJ22]|uniref:hypothetical protein n=1 Tax=Sphingosinicella sp. YJ22 TaxID=1104780 RepID=UPI00140C1934|nr:hypothetical protein [Sphingosinicella sp. YJ22]